MLSLGYRLGDRVPTNGSSFRKIVTFDVTGGGRRSPRGTGWFIHAHAGSDRADVEDFRLYGGQFFRQPVHLRFLKQRSWSKSQCLTRT